MGMYRLADGELVDMEWCTLISRAEDIDSSLVEGWYPDKRSGPNRRLILFIWEADIGLPVASQAEADELLEQYREGQLRRFYTEDLS
jgi:hypothetical protein